MSVNAVNSVSSNSASSSSSATKLSQDTINKLKALGLDPSKYTSESQAQQAIKEAQEKQSPQKPSGSNNFSTVKTDVQDLASKMGLVFGSNDKVDDILDAISNKIDELKAGAGTDETKLSQVNDYSNQYSTLSNEIAQMEAAKNMTGATAMANYNKAALGLAA